jgi:transposase
MPYVHKRRSNLASRILHRQILELVGSGLCAKDVSRRLNVGVSTVWNVLSRAGWKKTYLSPPEAAELEQWRGAARKAKAA